jgi:hypothetical protein
MTLEVGTKLADRFRLVEKLGVGAGGEVWKARDTELARDVAIKVLMGDRPGSTTVERFLREAALPSAIQHPGITVVYDAGVHRVNNGRGEERRGEERRCIVTELLIGKDLAGVLDDYPGGLATERVIDLGIQLADALAAAHAGNLIHRDLKPSNLFVLDGDRLKICDFGIAGDMSPDALAARITKVGTFVGTPLYMSPEQWDGRAPSPGMDLYSMGCLLYEMLTGQPPFEGDSLPDILRQHADADPIAPRVLKPSVPEALNDLTLRLLAKDPADRPASAREVAEELSSLRDARSRADIEALKDEAVRAAVADERAKSQVAIDEERARSHAAIEDAYRSASTEVQAANARTARVEEERALAVQDAQDRTASAQAALNRAERAAAEAEEADQARAAAENEASRALAAAEAAGRAARDAEIRAAADAVAAATARDELTAAQDRAARTEADLRDTQARATRTEADLRDTRARAARAEADLQAAIAAGARPPGQVTAPLACDSLGTGHFEVFILNGSPVLEHRTWSGTGWDRQPGIGLPGGKGTAIAACAYRGHRVLIAVADGIPHHREWFHQHGRVLSWADWEPLGGDAALVPADRVVDAAVASPAPEEVDIFTLDEAGRVRHRREGHARRHTGQPDQEDVALPPGMTATAIAATSYKEHLLTLVAVLDGRVQVRSWHHKSGWSGWFELGPVPVRARHLGSGPAVEDVACSSPAPGVLDVFALDADGGISQRTWSDRTNAWSDWVNAPAPGDRAIAITAASLGGLRQAIAAISPDASVGYASHYTEVTRGVTGQPRWTGWIGR